MKNYPHVKFYNFADAGTLFRDLSDEILKKKDVLRFACCAGDTVKAVFPMLGCENIKWAEIDIFPADERDVPETDENSNLRFLRRQIATHIKNKPRSVIPLTKNIDSADIILLSMAGDAHIASLFPGQAYDYESGALTKTGQKIGEDYGRLSLTPDAFEKSSHIILLVRGEGKEEILEKALKAKDSNQYPVYSLFERSGFTLHICK